MYIYRIYKKIKGIEKKEFILLIPIIILACILTFYPHFKYPYLLHVDEWFHVAQAKQVTLQTNVNWYTGENFQLGMEGAWHNLLATLNLIFKPSISQWIYLPTVFHIFSIFTVFYFVLKLFGKKEALISSFLIALLPSNVTMGGPVFLVPLNLGLIFIPLALLFAFNLTKLKLKYNLIVLFIILLFLLYSHPPTAVVLLIVLGVYFLLNIFSKKPENRIYALYLLAIIILSIIAAIPNYFNEIQNKGVESITFEFWVYLKEIPFIYGFIPTFLFIVGFYYLSKKDVKENWTLLISSLILLLNIVIFAQLGFNYLLPYQRTFIPLFLIMSIVASVGFIKLLKIKKPWKYIGLIFFVLLMISTALISINRNINQPYYQIIDDIDYDNFIWIKKNSPKDSIILCDPWKARALAPTAERAVYTVVPFGPDPESFNKIDNVFNFFQNECVNTSFLIKNNISVIYSRGYRCNNTDLNLARENIYFLK